MSFFNINENNISTKEKLTYLYSGVSINHPDITTLTIDDNKNSIKKKKLPEVEGTRIQEKNTFYQIKLRNKEPNFVYGGLSPSSYTAKSMYLFGLLHRNISGISSSDTSNIVGEIVIEHTNLNKQLQKVYTCFLIQNTDVSKLPDGQTEEDITNTSLDGLISLINNKLSPEYTFDLSSDIPTQTHSIHYADKTNHIFVFTNPIKVNKDTAKFFKTKLSPKTKLFSIYPSVNSSNQTIFYGSETILLNDTSSNTDGFRLMEGIDEDDNAAETNDIWIDCSPTGESDDTVQAIRDIPVDSEYSKHKEQIDGFKMITHFFMFILITLLAFFMVPKLYKEIVVDWFNKSPNPDDVHKDIFHADMAIIYIFLLNFFVCCFTKNIYIIMFTFAIAIASYALIQFSKTQSAFMTTNKTASPYKEDAPSQPEGASKLAGFTVIVGMLQALVGKGFHTDSRTLLVPYLFFAILAFCIILGIMYMVTDNTDSVQTPEYPDGEENSKFLNRINEFGKNFMKNYLTPIVFSLTVVSPIIILAIKP